MSLQLLKLNPLSHADTHFLEADCECVFPWSLWNSSLNSISCYPRESLHICVSWAKWGFLMSMCVCVWGGGICLSVCVFHMRLWNVKSLPSQESRWDAMETVPSVIFILNTTYSLPVSPLFVSVYSPFSPYLCLSFFLSSFLPLPPTHSLTGWEISLFIF